MSIKHPHAFRPLSIKQGETETTTLFPADVWPTVEQLRDEYHHTKSDPSQISTSTSPSEIELAANFLRFVTQRAEQEQDFLPVVKIYFQQFCDRFLKHNDIHAVVRKESAEARPVIINAFFTTFDLIKKSSAKSDNGTSSLKEVLKTSTPAIFVAAERGEASLFAIFGGQGNREEYFDELAEIVTTYGNLIMPFVTRMSSVLREHAKSSEASIFHSKGLDVLKWLEAPETRPDLSYLTSAPVSLPLIGLTQLLNYWVLLRVLDRPPSYLRKLFVATTGHSQGIVSSVVISASESEEDFIRNTEIALGLLFWLGTRAQQVFPPTTQNPVILQDSLSNNEGNPTPMLSITSLTHAEVRRHVETINLHLPEERKIELSLRNGPRAFVCSGPPQSLYGLNLSLRKLKAPSGLQQSRVPFSQRKIRFHSRFLPISAPFHSSYLADVPSLVASDIKRWGLSFKGQNLQLPVYSIETGEDLRSHENLTEHLVELIAVRPVHWEKATAVSVTHILDFGPGGVAGIGGLTHRNKDGSGARVVLAGTLHGTNRALSYKTHLFDSNISAIRYSQNWVKDFQPKLIRSNGRILVDTLMSQLLGKPPIMVAGMTPATVNERFVAAVMNAGYHVELAGGGHHSESQLRRRVQSIMEMTRPGEGISLNLLFLNARQWGFQYPLVMQMRSEGYPIEGVCIAAGVPSLELANEIVANLKKIGIKHVSFKPGSVESINQVIQIAAANPDMPIIMQWTGGRAGGHHSFEDMHQPILQTYSNIRRQPNIVLVAGSGFGDSEGTLPYLTGDWSVRFDYPPMPFDGILLASRMMVALEGQASLEVKQAIVDAPGADDKDWERTYRGEVGGVLTVRSELGEPIHKLATRGVRLWKELDDTIFSLPKDKRLEVLNKKKPYIISRLNADFQKVWFGKKADGKIADLQEMTYSEVVRRMIELMYISSEERWIHVTHRDLVGDFLRRVEERFSEHELPSSLQSYSQLQPPFPFVDTFLASYPSAESQLLTTEDVFHFLTLCQRRGQKPVPFIPILDQDFETWFKKDSLWQAEDIAAVVDRDVQRTCILQGPVAAKYSRKVNEPVAEILGNIHNDHVRALKERYYGNDDSLIPEKEYISSSITISHSTLPPSSPSSPSLFRKGDSTLIRTHETSDLPAHLPSVGTWLETLAGPGLSWFRALLSSAVVIQGKHFTSNPIPRIIRPRPGQRVHIHHTEQGEITRVIVEDRKPWSATGKSNEYTPSITIDITPSSGLIRVQLNEKKNGTAVVPLHLLFTYKPEMSYAPLHESMEGRNVRIKKFYHQLWFGDDNEEDLNSLLAAPVTTIFHSKGQRVDFDAVAAFCQAVGNQAEIYIGRAGAASKLAPMDFAITVGWKSIIKAIFPRAIDGDLLRLVHLSNGFRMLEGTQPLRQGDIVDTHAQIHAVVISESGKTVEVKGVIERDGKPVMEVTSKFLYRGSFNDYQHTFQRTEETPMLVKLPTKKDISVLQSKTWLNWASSVELQPGCALIFRLGTYVEYKARNIFSKVETRGTIWMQISTKEIIEVATVLYEAGESHGNPVTEYLKRVGQPIEQAVYFENGGYSIMPDGNIFSATVHAPATNEPYAKVSGDFNSIHVNPYFADLAQLPGTITHGMWTSASTRKFVEIFAADNNPQRVTGYDVNFLDMVLPSDRLETKLYHIGMKNGRKIIKVETLNQNGNKVLEGLAEVDQPTTAYVFTGQGSQEQGMGMALYSSSPVAREIWDKADQHFLNNYGFSILNIVRNNPRELTVYFGGHKGAAIRTNYTKMIYETVDVDGSPKQLPLFPDIDENSSQYTFSSPNGLLAATQFTQPALTLMEKAAFEDLRSRELVQQNCAFAGHSLGEYSALASIGDVLPIESLVDVVFYRGMTMQVAVERDEQNRSNYSMIAVNPSRVGRGLPELGLSFVVEEIARQSGGLIEIVNYNVENWQYVCAGELVNLETLARVLDELATSKELPILLAEFPRKAKEIKERLAVIVSKHLASARAKQIRVGYLELERSLATIPLKGIDVPFHSSFLRSGVGPFRVYLANKINPTNVNVGLLQGKYIPNVTAQPFSLAKTYVEDVYRATGSPILGKILKAWSDEKYSSAAQQQKLGYNLLVELLAYQFASPVLWIRTQDLLFKQFGVERLIEIGPSPTLCGMAQRTLKFKYETYDDALTYRRSTLCYAKDTKEIYYVVDPLPPPSTPSDPTPSTESVAPAQQSAPISQPAAVNQPVKKIEDIPLKAIDVLRTIVAQKLKKSLSDVPLSKSVKDLVGGKSTMQNEILGDLQKEFGSSSVPDKSEELPLEELGSQLQTSFPGTLGAHTTSLISRLFASKMPGGFSFSSAKDYLSSKFGLGPSRINGVFLHGLVLEPAARLTAEQQAKEWLTTVAEAYAAKEGLFLGAAEGNVVGGATAVVDSAQLKALEKQQVGLARKLMDIYANYLDQDLREGEKLFEAEKLLSAKQQSQLDLWSVEHGEDYAQGIVPIFSRLKARKYDSFWNWARQDALLMLFDIIFGKLTVVDREIVARCIQIMNRVSPSLVEYMSYHIDRCPPEKGETYKLAKNLGQTLIKNCKDVLNTLPVYRDVMMPTGPQTIINEKGDIVYMEVPREGIRHLEHYVKSMKEGGEISQISYKQNLQQNLQQMRSLLKGRNKLKKTNQKAVKALCNELLRSMSISNPTWKHNSPHARRMSRIKKTHTQSLPSSPIPTKNKEKIPYLYLQSRDPASPSEGWEYNADLTDLYIDVLSEVATRGLSFQHKNILITGCGKDSIGAEVLKGLLSGGARVIVTTSRFNRSATEYFQSIYQRYGSRGSCLLVVPFNQGSRQDVVSLVDYIYAPEPAGLGWDIDHVIPFAAVSEDGRELDQLDSRSELAHRIMLTNLLRLLGCIKSKKAELGCDTRPAQVILPLSPNHGTFGADGLYGESKMALETLFNRWFSESWGSYITIAGAVIGWTRGTGLMNANNLIADRIEKQGVRTFSAQEMAFNLIGLMHPRIVTLSQSEPVRADLTGGLLFIPNLKDLSSRLRGELKETAEIRRAIESDTALDKKVVHGAEIDQKNRPHLIIPRANLQFEFPRVKSQEQLHHLSHLRGMLDLDKVIVVTGFGEVGPWGNSRTRWEMEAYGQFSLEGCIEMAWIMGYIKHHHGPLKNGNQYSGWVDAATGEPVQDRDIKARYEEKILAHSGIRFIEPELFEGYDPNKKELLQEVVIDHDLEPFEASQEEAEQFAHRHGPFADTFELENGRWAVKLRKGATILLPKALRFARTVAGQIPTGWDPARYGIPQDIINQVDRLTLYVLVATVEALVNSGITDPYEFYEYVHVSEVGLTTGSGVGGLRSHRGIYRDRYTEKPVAKDVLQESFINTMSAWINMLLLSSSGPIKPPVGACATAVQSVEIAVDTILSGKAKVVIAGGFDDFGEESSYEFANMKATSDSAEEEARGRTPQEMSRPATSTRAGFMEAHGAGIHVLMTASLAIEMGVPIYGIIAITNTALDKEGRSVPAPGAGILTTARESKTENLYTEKLLDIHYRSKQLARGRQRLNRWLAEELENLREEQEEEHIEESDKEKWLVTRTNQIQREALRQEKALQANWGVDFYRQDPNIAPLRGALSVYGLTIDDISVASFHGTSTKANDFNESQVLDTQFSHLGRTKGNLCLCIFQKYLTGHPKGAAASWMFNGLLQVLQTGIVPGNRNADNIDYQFQQFSHLLYPSRSVHTDGVRAGLLKSFGFGQVGGEILVISSDYLFASLDPNVYAQYRSKIQQRQARSYRYLHDSMTGSAPFVQVKTSPPYDESMETKVYLDPLIRATHDPVSGSWRFVGSAQNPTSPSLSGSTGGHEAQKIESITSTTSHSKELLSVEIQQALALVGSGEESKHSGLGVDVELVSEFPANNETFLARNFTSDEIKYCESRPDPLASFAGRWCAKEAVVKAISSACRTRKLWTRGDAAPLKDIEIRATPSGAPEVIFHGDVSSVVSSAGISSSQIRVTISHAGLYSVAVAVVVAE